MKLVAARCPNCGANIDVDKDSDSTIASKKMFDTCGVKYRELNKSNQKDFNLSLKPDKVIEQIKG